MDVLDMIYDKAYCELEEIGKKDKLNSKDVELMDKFVDIIKDIEEMGMSSEPMGYSQTGSSYANGSNYTMRGRSNRMNPMYNRSYGRSSYGHNMNGEYSRDESKVMMLDQLERAMDMAVDEKDRKAVERLMTQMMNQN
jgi:hypothetical protein